MKKYNNYFLNIGYFLISLLVYLVLVSILASLNILPYKVVSIISFIVICLLFFISGLRAGKNSSKRGYLSGITIGVINILVLLFLGIILRSVPSLKSILYYGILILSSTIGGMLGINTRKGGMV